MCPFSTFQTESHLPSVGCLFVRFHPLHSRERSHILPPFDHSKAQPSCDQDGCMMALCWLVVLLKDDPFLDTTLFLGGRGRCFCSHFFTREFSTRPLLQQEKIRHKRCLARKVPRCLGWGHLIPKRPMGLEYLPTRVSMEVSNYT